MLQSFWQPYDLLFFSFVLLLSSDKKPMSTDVAVLATNLVIRNIRRHHAGVYVCRANKNMTSDFVNASAELHVSGKITVLLCNDIVQRFFFKPPL